MSRSFFGRGGRTRTAGLHVPNLVVRRVVLPLAAATCAFAIGPTPVSAFGFHAVSRPSETPTVDLIGYRSGFAKAREGRTSITVGSLPASWHVDSAEWLRPVIDHWNFAAGWELFVLDLGARSTDVTFQAIAGETCPNYGACTGWEQFDTGWYKHCYVMVWPWKATLRIVRHELGHCLGFRDVESSLDPYHGIMSYGFPKTDTPVNEYDVASLEAAGYRDPS